MKDFWGSLGSPFKVIPKINSNPALIALALFLAAVIAVAAMLWLSGILQWVIVICTVVGFFVVALSRTSRSPGLPAIARQEVLLALLQRGFFYGDSGKLVRLEDVSKQLPKILNPKELPPPHKEQDSNEEKGENVQ